MLDSYFPSCFQCNTAGRTRSTLSKLQNLRKCRNVARSQIKGPEKPLKDHTIHFACLSLIYTIFIHVTLLTIISQRIKPYLSFPDILLNLLIFQNQIFK
ncbi:hypothetical protein LDENG_00129770 [Lucifuga dentata]|nr:hypothetical protein LDENG_00129770 [Lucifuga dentata]